MGRVLAGIIGSLFVAAFVLAVVVQILLGGAGAR
jgi:hypothetical protein